MKPKPDEMPDEWVRQTLRRLPDAPPPGSSFDSERLWGQLRPELQSTTARRSIGWIKWVVAACLAGLVFVWFGIYHSSEKQYLAAKPNNTRKTNVHTKFFPKQNPYTEITQTDAPTRAYAIPMRTRTTTNHSKVVASKQPKTVPVVNELASVSSQAPDLVIAAETVTVAEKLPIPLKRNVASTPAKRRFKIVHENELRSEEEARPKLYSTENFVRLGTGQRTETLSNDHRPALVMPLMNKPNQ